MAVGVPTTGLPFDLDSFLEEVRKEAPKADSLGQNPGDPVPPVRPEDLKALWDLFEETGGRAVFFGDTLKDKFPQGTDLRALNYRCMQLLVFGAAPEMPPLKQEGKMPEAVLRVASRFPMVWQVVGAKDQGQPYDLEAFLEEVRNETDETR
jgi:hypothetical protein